jgi:hypothetical protein
VSCPFTVVASPDTLRTVSRNFFTPPLVYAFVTVVPVCSYPSRKSHVLAAMPMSSVPVSVAVNVLLLEKR